MRSLAGSSTYGETARVDRRAGMTSFDSHSPRRQRQLDAELEPECVSAVPEPRVIILTERVEPGLLSATHL